MNHEDLMRGLTVQRLRFRVRPLETIVFGDQPGSALRGALYEVLADNFCSERNGFITPDHASRCPVCWLLAAEDEKSARGQNIPRPLTVEPPLGRSVFNPHQELVFGFSLIGQAQNLLPYLARAVQKMGEVGVGRGRGRFKLLSIMEYNALFDAERTLLNGNVVKRPMLQVTPSRISEAAAKLNPHKITLEFLTPLRLIADRTLVMAFDPVIFIQRLHERCQGLAERYAETDVPVSWQVWQQNFERLSEAARQVKIAYDDTTWLDTFSGSRRQGRATPIGGLIGTVRWEGDLADLLPWILWGASLHVGKNAVKGNGFYRLVV